MGSSLITPSYGQLPNMAGVRFESVLLTSPSSLWLTPAWPHCLHSLHLVRHHGLTWWVPRSSLAAVFGGLERHTERPSERHALATARFANRDANRTHARASACAAAAAAPDGGLVGIERSVGAWFVQRATGLGARPSHDWSLASAVTLTPTPTPMDASMGASPHEAGGRARRAHGRAATAQAPLHGIAPACEAWAEAQPTHLVPTRRVALLPLPCPTAARLLSAVASGGHAAGADRPHASAASRLVCSGAAAGRRRQRTVRLVVRLALCIGGLARTFGHAVVYRSLKGHVMEALGFDETRVFAHLRLDDKRGITGFGRRDLGGTIDSSEGAVRHNRQ